MGPYRLQESTVNAVGPTGDERLRALRRTRQYRDFGPQPVAREDLDAIVDVARWSGSSSNSQPWRFIVIRDPATIRAIHDLGVPQTHGLATATAAIAIVMPSDPKGAIHDAYDEGRVSERILIAAGMLDLGAGISWILPTIRDQVAALLGLPADRMVRTMIQVGHPTAAARKPKSAPGKARLPREEVVFEERWPSE
jgi:nitroreductase